MHDRLHQHDHSPVATRRRFSLAQQGIAVRLLVAVALVGLVWAAILPLVAS